MATYEPPKKNTAYVFYLGLISQANTKVMQANPTLAAGDFKVAIDDGAPANFATLPVVDADFTKRVKVELSAGEMNGDNITVVCSDAAGAEWCDLILNLQTTARQIDDLAYPATSGRSMVVDAAGLVDANMVKMGPTGSGQAITAAAGVTFPSSVASPTNITAGTITTATNLTTNNDKTGYGLAAGEHTNIAADAQTGLTAQGYTTTRAGYLDTLNGLVTAIWANVARTITGGTVTTNSDKTGYALSGAGVTAVQSGLSTLTAAQVNSEVLDVLTVDTFAEVTSAPAATSSLKDKIGWLFKLSRNLRKTTSTTDSVYNDAGAVVDSTSTISDDGTTFTRSEYT